MEEKNFASGEALLEIGTEELPAGFFYGALEQLPVLAEKQLSANRLQYERLNVYGTPRRLVLEINGLIARQPDENRSVRGPAKSAAYDGEEKPTPALAGFLKGQGASLESVQVKEVSGKPYVFVEVHQKGRPAREVLAEIFPELIRKLSFPKSMRWDGEIAFGRPIRWLLALFENQIVQFKLGNLESGNFSCGHRFLSAEKIAIPHPSVYKESLKKAFVIASDKSRKEIIRNQVENLALSQSAQIFDPDSLIQEVTLLVEYPAAFLGNFDKRFLSLPQEVLITVMRRHQRYFPLVNGNGELLSFFIAVRNGNEEGLEDVRSGNEQVLRARFKDAEYFFETDKKKKLLSHLDQLDKLVFQKNLGTLKQKVERLFALMRYLRAHVPETAQVPDEERKLLSQDAELDQMVSLSKCDLTTQMVFELPELQGIMGKEYARLEGYPEVVCQSIRDHYLPRFPGDELPKTFVGALLGIADRIDTLAGCFGLNAKPSGSSDPLGLRRAATGLLQILIEKNLEFDMEALIQETIKQYKAQFDHAKEWNEEFLLKELRIFFLERNETLLKGYGIRYDSIRCITPIALRQPVAAYQRSRFLEDLRSTKKEKFVSLILAWTRIFNILKSKEAEASLHKEGNFSNSNFVEEEEKNLDRYFQNAKSVVEKNWLAGKTEEAWNELSRLEEPINRFFDKVLVMSPDENVRKNRLLLLKELQNLMLTSFGDITQIVLD